MNIRMLTAASVLLAGLFGANAALADHSKVNLNVRSGPGMSHGVVDVLWPGEPVIVTGCDGNWCAIKHIGPDGYVYKPYLTKLFPHWAHNAPKPGK